MKCHHIKLTMCLCTLSSLGFSHWNGKAKSVFPVPTIFRLRAGSLFTVVPRAKRETRKWPRAWLMARDGRGAKKESFSSRAATLVSRVARACTPLTKSQEKERLLAVYTILGSLSKGIFERCTSTGSEVFFILKHLKGAVSRNSAKLGNYKMPVKLRET